MTIEKQIRRDLTASQATASAIALRLKKSSIAIESVLKRMEEGGEVVRRPICGGTLTVWRLTEDVRRP